MTAFIASMMNVLNISTILLAIVALSPLAADQESDVRFLNISTLLIPKDQAKKIISCDIFNKGESYYDLSIKLCEGANVEAVSGFTLRLYEDENLILDASVLPMKIGERVGTNVMLSEKLLEQVQILFTITVSDEEYYAEVKVARDDKNKFIPVITLEKHLETQVVPERK